VARTARKKVFHSERIGIYHCTQRCVRRAFLCGQDPYDGRNYEHRRQWIRDLLEKLAGIFGFEFLTYSVMSNHLHVVVRNRPDLVDRWSHREVARRWWQLYPKRRNRDGSPAEMTPSDLKALLADRKQIAQWRTRLKCISWLMKSLAEPIARRSNAEDEVQGRFWQGRFRCQELTDPGALLACCIYVDLNPLRAGLARSLITARFTSLYDRLKADRARKAYAARRSGTCVVHADLELDGWLTPLELNPRDKPGEVPSRSPRRLSDRGFLEMSLDKYCELAEWTLRNRKQAGPCQLPAQLETLVREQGIRPELWGELAENFGKWFGRCVGRPDALEQLAKRQQYKWLRGISHCRDVFGV
jgi:REP element-mobilizing transposase RayT